jgi:hypothetical protein
MEKDNRKAIGNYMKNRQRDYLAEIACHEFYPSLETRFKKLTRLVRSLLRKEYVSSNALTAIAQTAKLIFGLMEDIKREHLPGYTFEQELLALNDYLIKYLEAKWASEYGGECRSCGETALVLYLDLFIALTVSDLDKELQAKPSFLRNPATGAILEIDVMFENYHIALEFQGEHHYTDNNVKEKDQFKIRRLREKQIILIPVNIFQLYSHTLQMLIINSIKDFLGIHDLFTNKRDEVDISRLPSTRQMLNFSKVTQRLYLCKHLFAGSLKWLDTRSREYIINMAARSPISSSTSAPRQTPPRGDMDIDYLYKQLKYVTKARRGKAKL